MNYPYCKKHRISLIFDGYASMGSFHSNYYNCPKCKKTIEIKDACLGGNLKNNIRYFNMKQEFYGIDD